MQVNFSTYQRLDIKFAEVYLTEFNGDGLEAAANVYNLDLNNRGQYTQARQLSNRLLSNSDIITLITAQLNRKGLNDNQIDKVLYHWFYSLQIRKYNSMR